MEQDPLASLPLLRAAEHLEAVKEAKPEVGSAALRAEARRFLSARYPRASVPDSWLADLVSDFVRWHGEPTESYLEIRRKDVHRLSCHQPKSWIIPEVGDPGVRCGRCGLSIPWNWFSKYPDKGARLLKGVLSRDEARFLVLSEAIRAGLVAHGADNATVARVLNVGLPGPPKPQP